MNEINDGENDHSTCSKAAGRGRSLTKGFDILRWHTKQSLVIV